MKENLQKLYNTLVLIETKGENTKIMADCLRYTEQLIQQAPDVKEPKKKEE